MTHVTMKADNTQELQPASWRSRRADSIIPVQGLTGWRPGKSQCFSLRPKAGKKQ